MIKILHTADIHLDSPLKSLALRDEALRDRVQVATRGAFSRIVDAALDEGVAALLIAGDLYDRAVRSARTAAFLVSELDRLRVAGINVFYIKGNHDAENPLTGEVALPDNVHLFDGRGGRARLGDHNVWIHGVSFSGRHAPDSLVPKLGAPVSGALNIAMLHTSLAGAAGHDVYAPCSVAELQGSGFDYWALGHVHRRQISSTAPWIVMPGIPQGRDIGEAGPKSATLLTITDGQIAVSEIATSRVQFERLDVDATGCADDTALRDLLRDTLRAFARGLRSDTAILRLRLTGAFSGHWQVERDRETWAELIAEMAHETGCLGIDKLEFAFADPVATDSTGTAAAELTDFMQMIRREPATVAAMEAQLVQVLGELPTHLRATLLPDAQAQTLLTERLAESGAHRISALMKGATE